MKNGSPDFPNPNLRRTPVEYGSRLAANASETKRNLWTLLTGNGVISTRLGRALGLKDPPGHPDRADMSEVKIVTDMMQGGFSAYLLNTKYLISSAVAAFTDGAYGNLIAPAGFSDDPARIRHFQGAAITAVNTDPMLKNNADDNRVVNAVVRYYPVAAGWNPQADTNPESLHCRFMVDGNTVFEQVQNNLVASAADRVFISQTGDGTWNGIVPVGSYLSFWFYKNNGLTGAFKPLNAGDYFEIDLTTFSAPAGTRLPGQ